MPGDPPAKKRAGLGGCLIMLLMAVVLVLYITEPWHNHPPPIPLNAIKVENSSYNKGYNLGYNDGNLDKYYGIDHATEEKCVEGFTGQDLDFKKGMWDGYNAAFPVVPKRWY